jgi:hypothetical protein
MTLETGRDLKGRNQSVSNLSVKKLALTSFTKKSVEALVIQSLQTQLLQATVPPTTFFNSFCFRLLWEEEEKLNAVETETRNIQKEKQNKPADVWKRLQSKAPLCCPHLFMGQKPRLDVDIRQNIKMSP